MRVQKETPQGVIYIDHLEAVTYLKDHNFEAAVSFPVNHRSTALLAATEKDEQGRFIVPALATDGGAIPRNFLLSHGLSLVRFDALSLIELVHKSCWAPARMLGLPNKGHLAPGADADIVVTDPATHQAVLTVVGGHIVMVDGMVLGSGGTLITTPHANKKIQAEGVQAEAAHLADSLFYNAPEI